MAKAVELDAGALMAKVTITIKVRRLRQYQVRVWIAARLLEWAVRIGGFQLVVLEEPPYFAQNEED